MNSRQLQSFQYDWLKNFVTKADASTGRVSFAAWFLGFVTVNQIGEKYYNVFEKMGFYYRLFQLRHKRCLKILKEVMFLFFHYQESYWFF